MALPSWMLARLAIETFAHHASADADRLWLLDQPAITAHGYRRLLRRIYGFEAPLEAALALTPGLDLGLLRPRLKTARLAGDLLTLGMSERELAEIPRVAIAPFRAVPQALGWMYVVERQTLLHGLLYRRLATANRGELAGAGSYLAHHGATPGARFRELGTAIDRVASVVGTPDRIVAAAHAGFRAQRRWFRLTQDARRSLAS
jgi:heme oxygenase